MSRRRLLSTATRSLGRLIAGLLFLGLLNGVAAGATPTRLFLPLISRPEGFSEELLGSFSSPTAIAGLPDGRLLVGERTGRVWLMTPTGQATSFLDLRLRVVAGQGELGLFAIVLDPRYGDGGYLYVMFSGTPDDPDHILIARYRAANDGATADPNSELLLLDVPRESPLHNGGGLAFGPADGWLYAGVGDGQMAMLAQQADSVRGKIVRLNVAQAPAAGGLSLAPWLDASASVPATIFALGLRNPWRIAFDPATADLFIGDVGEVSWEEVNRAPGGQAGLNFGWPCREGSDALSDGGQCAGRTFTAPLHAYAHLDGRCAIIGGGVQRLGQAAPRFIFGDLCTREVMALQPDANGAWQPSMLGQLNALALLTTFGQDAAGRFYATTAAEGAPLRRLTLPPN